MDSTTTTTTQDAQEREVIELTRRLYDRDGGTRYRIVHHSALAPVLQTGPTCGLVALLAIHARLSGTEPRHDAIDAALAFARGRGYTEKGEMFSVEALASVATEHFGLRASVCDATPGAVVESVGKGAFVCVCYDMDGNFEPAEKQGGKAHWCVVNGVSARGCAAGDVLVHVVHGKSRRQAVWRLDALLNSNAQLARVAQRVMGGGYVVPQGGDVSQSLAGRMLVVSRE